MASSELWPQRFLGPTQKSPVESVSQSTMPQAQLASASDDRSELRAQVSQLEAAAVAAAQAVQRAEREAREEAERAQECGVCLCERKTHMFTPCGHKCVCEGCADELLRRGDRCPVCRAAVEGAVRVFD